MIRLGYLKLKNEFELDDKNLRNLTHINLAFGKVVSSHGEVEFDACDEQKLHQFRVQNPNIIMSLAIGGWSAGNFSEAASNEKARQLFSKTTLEIVEKYNLDGVDLDWEYPCCSDAQISSSADDKENFTRLMRTLRDDLNKLETKTKKKYILTFAAGANDKLIECYEHQELAKITDFMNLMTYDMGGSFRVAGHHASLYPSELCDNKGGAYFVDLFDKAGYPKHKIVLGAAFYGRGGDKVAGIGKQFFGREGLYFDYHDVLALIADGKTQFYNDDKAKAGYCYDGNIFITIETEDAIRAKVDYVLDNQLAGIMFWEYATDNTGILLDIVTNYRRIE